MKENQTIADVFIGDIEERIARSRKYKALKKLDALAKEDVKTESEKLRGLLKDKTKLYIRKSSTKKKSTYLLAEDAILELHPEHANVPPTTVVTTEVKTINGKEQIVVTVNESYINAQAELIKTYTANPENSDKLDEATSRHERLVEVRDAYNNIQNYKLDVETSQNNLSNARIKIIKTAFRRFQKTHESSALSIAGFVLSNNSAPLCLASTLYKETNVAEVATAIKQIAEKEQA